MAVFFRLDFLWGVGVEDCGRLEKWLNAVSRVEWAVLESQKRVLGATRTVEAQLKRFQRGMLAARQEAIPVRFEQRMCRPSALVLRTCLRLN